MLFNWNKWIWMSSSPFVIFAILLVCSQLIYYAYFSRLKPNVDSGFIIMALAVTVLYALPPFSVKPFLFLIIAYELMIVWLYVTFELTQILLQGFSLKKFIDRINLGTWITATVFAVIVLDQAEPMLLGVIALLSIATGLLYLIYIAIIFEWLFKIFKQPRQFFTANFFLFSIATESIAILLDALFHENIPFWIYEVIINTGILFYALSFILLFQYLYFHQKNKRLRFSKKGSFTYATAAIIGLAAVYTEIFSEHEILFIWWVTVLLFAIDLVFVVSIFLMGLNGKNARSISNYKTEQWIAIFNIGIFYGFTFVLNEQLYAHNRLLFLIITFGPYIVVALTLVQLMRLGFYVFNQSRNAKLV